MEQLAKLEGREEDVEAQCEDKRSWVIKQSYEKLLKSHSDDIMVLFILCQVPNGLFQSDLEMICSKFYPNWKEILTDMIIQRNRINLENNEADDMIIKDGQDTSWLVAQKLVEELNQDRYYAYQIVYSYINRSIMTNHQKRLA